MCVGHQRTDFAVELEREAVESLDALGCLGVAQGAWCASLAELVEDGLEIVQQAALSGVRGLLDGLELHLGFGCGQFAPPCGLGEASRCAPVVPAWRGRSWPVRSLSSRRPSSASSGFSISICSATFSEMPLATHCGSSALGDETLERFAQQVLYGIAHCLELEGAVQRLGEVVVVQLGEQVGRNMLLDAGHKRHLAEHEQVKVDFS